MFCTGCGKKISDNSKFCIYCGKTIRAFSEKEDIALKETPIPINKTKRGDKKILPIFLSAVVLVLISALLLIFKVPQRIKLAIQPSVPGTQASISPGQSESPTIPPFSSPSNQSFQPPSSKWGITANSNVNVRKEPSLRSTVVTKLNEGERVLIIEKKRNENTDEAVTTQPVDLISNEGYTISLDRQKALIIIEEGDPYYKVKITYEGREIIGAIPASAVKKLFGVVWYHVKTEKGIEGWICEQIKESAN